ncbi:MAG: polysaccharide deacetylase [Ruminococcus sp.]|jgi:hypothetical protein
MDEKEKKMSEEERRRMLERKRREKARQRKRKAMMMRAAVVGGLALVVILLITVVAFGVRRGRQEKAETQAKEEQARQEEETRQQKVESQRVEAQRVAAGYDYDGAIEILQTLAEEGEDVQAEIDEYEEAKSALKAADVETIPHVFFHILVADPSITWNLSGEDEYKVADYNQVMTTVDEFKAILQQMYDRGYVLVRIHDLVEETKNEDGETVFTEGKIMLPEGKKPFVMSQDDVCYYFYMIGDGFASKMVVGEDGRPTTEYINQDGSTVTGPYDLVPILNEFIDEHPDFSYKGAKAILAFTGYNGVLGYRTDPDLAKTAEEGNSDAEEYGTFDYEAEIEAAKPVVQALKDDGWELASHSYGHISYGSSFEKVKEDADKWQERVANVIGPTDIILFPFGTDIGSWTEYAADNQTYQYLHGQGFRFFCNVDSNPYWVQIREDYVRQGRRNLDGYRMYQDLNNGADKLSDLFDVSQVFDTNRPETGLQVWDGAE